MRDLWFEWYEQALFDGADTSHEAWQEHLFEQADLALGDE